MDEHQYLSKVKEIKEVTSLREVDYYKERGWMLLHQTSSRYVIGQIPNDVGLQHN